mmetsp:Transcript_730/g.1637  ORF Transcript_730/g.1637 Transcript_730/m.1637 type:complete len:88 (+) Transcript_730:272-535(+)
MSVLVIEGVGERLDFSFFCSLLHSADDRNSHSINQRATIDQSPIKPPIAPFHPSAKRVGTAVCDSLFASACICAASRLPGGGRKQVD